MNTATAFLSVMISALLTSSIVDAQVSSQPPVMRVVPASAVENPRTRARQPEPHARNSAPSFRMIGFAFWTGGDDLRNDSVVTALLTFPDGSKQKCPLHGAQVSGAAANISWDNNSSHDAPPCRLDTPKTMRELREARVIVGLYAPGTEPTFGTMLASGGLASVSIRSQDNWDIARVDVKAYNQDSNAEGCVRSATGNPVARLTGDQPEITISNFPNQCH